MTRQDLDLFILGLAKVPVFHENPTHVADLLRRIFNSIPQYRGHFATALRLAEAAMPQYGQQMRLLGNLLAGPAM
jgi:protoporphyrinogen oxidase